MNEYQSPSDSQAQYPMVSPDNTSSNPLLEYDISSNTYYDYLHSCKTSISQLTKHFFEKNDISIEIYKYESVIQDMIATNGLDNSESIALLIYSITDLNDNATRLMRQKIYNNAAQLL